MRLIPEQETEAKEFFNTPEEYNEFCRKFVDEVGPGLERQREARQQSEADAKQRRCGAHPAEKVDVNVSEAQYFADALKVIARHTKAQYNQRTLYDAAAFLQKLVGAPPN